MASQGFYTWQPSSPGTYNLACQASRVLVEPLQICNEQRVRWLQPVWQQAIVSPAFVLENQSSLVHASMCGADLLQVSTR